MKELGEYRELRLLGGGLGARVYRGLHAGTGREYALKVFGPLEKARRSALAEALDEAAPMHPGFLKLHGLKTDGATGCCYLVMEYAKGGDLRRRLDRGPLKPGPALETALGIAGALAPAHRAGICHLDLKPEQVFFDAEGRVRLAAPGLGLLAEEPALDEITRGAASYLAPEQLEGDGGPASDVHALGAMLFEMLTGLAYAKGSAPGGAGLDPAPPKGCVQKRLESAGVAQSAGVADLLERFLAPLPEDRPAHAGQAAALLELLAAGSRPAAFNRTMELANRCEICRKPIPLSRRLCPICSGREGSRPVDGPLPEAGGQSGARGKNSGLRSAGMGIVMLLLLGAGLFSWQGGAAWRQLNRPPTAEAPAPASDLHALLPGGVGILGAAAKGREAEVGSKSARVTTATAKVEQQRESLDNAKELNPGVREALYTSAAKAGSLGKAVRADLERSPQSLGARRNLALLLMQKGSYDKAAGLLRGILKENPPTRRRPAPWK